uniref:Uncharacterized protein n=1 Tax=Caenorhabditis tropicalis TaxID=1561998 RepID=A0A1I7TZY0_9PELO
MDKQQSNAANVASDSSVIVSNNNLPTVQNNAELQAIPLDLSFPSFLIKMLGVNPLAYSNVGDHTTPTTPSNESNHNQNEQSYPKSPDFEVKDPSQIPYFNSIMNSKAALHIHEGITPHVSTASCLPTNEYPKYAMKRTLDDESMNPKRPRPDGDCLAHNILKTITTELIPVVNEVIERPPSVEFLCFKKAEEASMTGHVPQMASMIATGQCQGVPAFFPTVPQINNYSVNQTIQTAPEPVQSQIPPAVQQKTLSTIHVFTDVNGGNSNDL